VHISKRWMVAGSTATLLAWAVWGPAAVRAEQQHPKALHVTHENRLELIRRAQVWRPTDVASKDLRTGPMDVKGFQPNETVSCEYRDHKREGGTPKFYCALDEQDVVKVKYGRENGEVYGEVLATRLMWALGFGVDRIYPVKVICQGCSSDPWNDARAPRSVWTFDPAIIEREFPGQKIETKDGSGWKWAELDLVDDEQGGASRAQLDGLKLLAVFIQHTDTKPQQQRLVCLSAGGTDHRECSQPFMLLNDVGVTFGEANLLNSGTPGSVNFKKWSETPVWKDGDQCIGNLKKSFSGTLENPRISEGGRAFLADLLVKLSDHQLRDLFDVARVELRSRKPGSSEPGASVDDWMQAFKQKRDAIVTHKCPSGS
jgi:hypothetical protein